MRSAQHSRGGSDIILKSNGFNSISKDALRDEDYPWLINCTTQEYLVNVRQDSHFNKCHAPTITKITAFEGYVLLGLVVLLSSLASSIGHDTDSLNRNSFPVGFIFGTASASYQVISPWKAHVCIIYNGVLLY